MSTVTQPTAQPTPLPARVVTSPPGAPPNHANATLAAMRNFSPPVAGPDSFYAVPYQYGPLDGMLFVQNRMEQRAHAGQPAAIALLISPDNRATRMRYARAIAHAAQTLRTREGLTNNVIKLVHEANRLIARRPKPPLQRKMDIKRIAHFMHQAGIGPESILAFPTAELVAPALRLRIDFQSHNTDDPYPDVLAETTNLIPATERESASARASAAPVDAPPESARAALRAAPRVEGNPGEGGARPPSPTPTSPPSAASAPPASPSSTPPSSGVRASAAVMALLLFLVLLTGSLSPAPTPGIGFDRSAGVGENARWSPPNERRSTMAAKNPAKLRCGVIGAGAIAGNHVQGFLAHPQAELVAIADVSQERCNAMADQYKIAKRYYDTKDLLADKDIDVVGIALPNFLHAPVSIAALNAGKHVMLDKPFALSAAEARKIIAAAKKAKKKLMVGMSHRFPRDSQSLRQLVDQGVLGDVYSARAMWLRRSGIPKFGTWFGRKDQAGGGCLYDIGVHYLDKAMFTMNCYDVESVHGQVYTKFGNRGLGEGGWGKSDRGKHVFDVDDFALALIKLKGGKTISLNVSWAAHNHMANEEYVQLFGTEGGAMVEPLRIWKNGKTGYEIIQHQQLDALVSTNRHVHFLDYVLGKDKPLVTLEQALIVQATLDGIYESSATGREVRIKS